PDCLLHGRRASRAVRGRRGREEGATTVGQRSNRKLGGVVLTAVALSAAVAGAASLNERARLREGPSKESKMLGYVEDGTAVTIEGQRSGWYSVRTADGQTGFIWQEHLRFDTGEAAAAAA